MTWGNDLPRIVTWGIFQNKYTNEKFVLMNTHFHWDEPYVTNTTKLILRKWCEIANNLPTILLGDFNLSPNSFAHDAFCGKIDTLAVKGNFIDTWQALNKPETDAGTYNNFKGEKTRDRIDWILVTPEVKVNNIEIIHYNENGRYPSDHFPVLAQVELSSK
jgi:endonuclease/exonuclease/phosphatase family metal-dependent hydrolase